MGQTYGTITLASDTGATVFATLATRTDTLRSSFSGSSAPGSPVAGQLWEDTTSATDGILSHYDGDGWVEIGTKIHTDLEFGTSTTAPNEAKFMNLENRTAHPTPGAAQVGRIYIFTTDSKGRLVVSATETEVLMSANNTDFMGAALGWIPIGACDLDATNPPTAVTVGTTPVIRGKQFDATNEKASFAFVMPAGYAADADVKVKVFCYLAAAETAADTIDATLDYRALDPDSSEVPTGTSTQATVSESIGANNAQYAAHEFEFTLTYNDANNPLVAGDLVECEFSLSSIASVTGIIVRGFLIKTPFGTKITE